MEDSLSSWEALASEAGKPAPRLYESWEDGRSRLFGAARPLLRLWHDVSVWHPFALQVWLLIEAMRIPHERKVVPLSMYAKASDSGRLETFRQEVGGSPDGVPYIQEAAKNSTWSRPWKEKSAVDLAKRLNTQFPNQALVPRSPNRRKVVDSMLKNYGGLQGAAYGILRGPDGAPQAAQEKYIKAMDAWAEVYANRGSSNLTLVDSRSGLPDDGDGNEAYFGGRRTQGPFLFGARPCVVDVLLLPLLERCEANVPHPVVGGLPHLALTNWPPLDRLLAAAREDGGLNFPFCSLLGDAISVSGVRMAVTGMVAGVSLPDPPPSTALAMQRVNQQDENACREAASRLSNNGAPVAGFAAAGSGTGRPRQEAGRRPPPTAGQLQAVDALLRGVARSLLICGNGTATAAAVKSLAEDIASKAASVFGAESVRYAAQSLVFLAENTGVPRDMAVKPAAAFRAHNLLYAAAGWQAAKGSRNSRGGDL
ncbi:unnamed protein product [Amoebophrya sp. A25]|nr:unnamed protein product [Amoebophrya sp. A25]|eukprot:GSA25T00005520001.1